MPSVPKWLGDTLEKLSSKYYHAVTVTDVTYLNESLKKVRFEGDIKSIAFTPGQVVEFRVTDTDYRHYTPSVFDTKQKACEVIFYLHGRGIGSMWAEALEEGQQLKLIGPGGKLAYRSEFPVHLVFGDETSVGLAHCIANECERSGSQFKGLLEFAPENISWEIGTDDRTTVVRASMDSPAKRALEVLESWQDIYGDKVGFYLTGRAKSIQRVRGYLLEKGVPRKHIQTEPYWAEGKRGL
ncbi:hypothetical protein GCM10011386_23160 [Parapedobacter defluvii]|uniref:FAD-binding FR-type domain-containing protein n=1 Tax=Parapedobacter defluvii TaxID=2045106 RepID=A0ABQ1LVB7_9SPHI|nr:siderophore-interacting protein [Parapedobacter defluvii]GGC30501.1 hypothetical protein GCM10011386_23160 [Parapedobacter defluvii]